MCEVGGVSFFKNENPTLGLQECWELNHVSRTVVNEWFESLYCYMDVAQGHFGHGFGAGAIASSATILFGRCTQSR